MAKNPVNKKQNKKKHSISFYLIIISLIILAIPMTFLGVTGINSLMNRGKPVIGNRFSNDQNPKIEASDLESLKGSLSTIEGVEDVKLNLAAGTLRIYLLNPNLNSDALKQTQQDAYDIIDETLEIDTYFKTEGIKKQYDLEIHVYNQEKVTEETEADYLYAIYVKNGNMEKPYSQILTKAQSDEMVKFFEEEEAYNSQPHEEEPIEDETDAVEEGE